MLELTVCTTVVRVGETVVVVVEVNANVDVVEAVVEVGNTNTVSVNVVWVDVAYLTYVKRHCGGSYRPSCKCSGHRLSGSGEIHCRRFHYVICICARNWNTRHYMQ